MDIGRTVSVSGLEDDDTDIDGIRLEDEDLAEAPNPVLDVPSIESPTRAPTDDSDNCIKLNKKKMKTRKVNDTPQSSAKGDFFALPLNIMNEIFGHLHPSDLLCLARTSKILRSHIMSKRLTNVWKKVLGAVRPMIPECPKDQSEPQWVALLFTRDCSMCGAPQSDRVGWALHLRCCEDCFETNLLSDSAAAEAYPNVDDMDDILDLIPHITQRSSLARGRGFRRELYYSADIKRMVESWMGYRLRIDYGIQGAHDEFLQFQENRKREVEKRFEVAKELIAWENEMADQLAEERADLIVDKLVELGHDPRDARSAVNKVVRRWLNVFYTPSPLSDADWKCVKPMLEQRVAEERLSRTRLERKPIRDERKGIAILRYATFKKTYDPSPDNLLPDDSVFLDIPMIDATIESDGDDALPTMFDSVFDQLSDYLDEWRRERRVDLARMLIEAQEVPNGPRQDPAVAETEGILLLAASIFACCTTIGAQQKILHWVETLGDHVNGAGHSKWLGGPTVRALKCVKVIPEWLTHVRALIQAAGLNPDTATQRDMDERDARLYCKDCSAKRLGGTLARSWRNCVLHMGYHGTTHIKLKGYELLSTQARADIKARENAISTWQAIDWNQVAISLQGVAADLQGSVVELKAPPSQPSARATDSKAAARNSKAIASRHPVTGSQDMTVKCLRCKLCPKSNREFAALGLADHVVKKHQIKKFRIEDLALVAEA